MQTSWHSQQKPVCWEKTLVFGIQYFTSIRLIINSLINAKPYTVSGCIKNDLTGARFGSTYTKIGTIQRRLAWPLRKDDMQIREAFHVKKKKNDLTEAWVFHWAVVLGFGFPPYGMKLLVCSLLSIFQLNHIISPHSEEANPETEASPTRTEEQTTANTWKLYSLCRVQVSHYSSFLSLLCSYLFSASNSLHHLLHVESRDCHWLALISVWYWASLRCWWC